MAISETFMGRYWKLDSGESRLTAGHKVSGNMFERKKHFEAKCGGRECDCLPIKTHHPYSPEFNSSLPGCSFGNCSIATYSEQSDFSSFHFKLPSATKFGYICFGGWYELRLESLNNPDGIKRCKILRRCHGLYRCTQMAVSSFYRHTMWKMSKIYFSLHFPCAWGLNELILSFCVFIKILCFWSRA